MNFTGKNLQMVREGLATVVAELHNRWVSCPDPVGYFDELQAVLSNKKRYEKLLARVDKTIAKELDK